MHFGVTLPHFRHLASPDALRTVAHHAERLGLDSIWVTDHVVLPNSALPKFGEMFYEPLTVLGYVAGITSRISIGTSAIILSYRNPLVTAKQLSTIDVLSEGRLIFGAAAGWAEDEFRALGVGFEDRGVRSDEYLRVIRTLWTEDRPQFNGDFARFSDITFQPKPVQQPHPPIWIGGNSGRGIRRAAEFGDCWHPTRPSVEDIRIGRVRLVEAVQRAGRETGEVSIAVREPFKLDETMPADPRKPLLGPRAHILDSLAAFAELGVTHFVIDLFYSISALHDSTLDSVMKAMEVLAEDIRPNV